MNILEELTGILAAAFEAAGYDAAYGTVSVSNRPDLCQYQCSGAMTAAKQYRKAPAAIAADVVEKAKESPVFKTVELAMPGFINLTLTDEAIAARMEAMAASERLALPTMPQKTIVVDFGGPNVAKPLHVGHLRSAIIGDSLCRLARFMGHNVIGDTHLGDWGLQMGMVIAGIRDSQPGLPYFDEAFEGEYPAQPPVTVDDLNEIYPAASARAKVDEAFAREAAAATVDLQNGRRGYRALWQHIWNVSVADLKASYDILGVHFDKWYGESDADAYIPQVLKTLKEKGLMRESSGAMVVDVEEPEDKEPMPPIIVVKSDGGDIYGTTDLGTLLQRQQDFAPDEIWYVVDNRQALHFKQVFRCAHKAGLTSAECTHIGFGTMNGKDGKPYKTREGGVMRLSDLIAEVTENAYAVTAQSGVEMNEAARQHTARVTGVAALKVGDMLNFRTKDYIFDLDKFMATEGKTGPYLLYTAVRIRSLLKKAGWDENAAGSVLPPQNEAERSLMLQLLDVPQSLARAYAEKAPNVICEALFGIASSFNSFYAGTKILIMEDAAQKQSALALCALVLRMLVLLLSLLGIEVPDAM